MFKIITVREYNRIQNELSEAKKEQATFNRKYSDLSVDRNSLSVKLIGHRNNEIRLKDFIKTLGDQVDGLKALNTRLEARVTSIEESRKNLMERNGALEKKIESLSPKQVEAIEPFAPNGDLDANLKQEPAVQEARAVEKPKKRPYNRRKK